MKELYYPILGKHFIDNYIVLFSDKGTGTVIQCDNDNSDIFVGFYSNNFDMEGEFVFYDKEVIIKAMESGRVSSDSILTYCGFDNFPYMYILSFNNKKEILSYNKGVVLYVDNRSYPDIKIGDYYKNINKELLRNVLKIGDHKYHNSEEYPLGSFVVRTFDNDTVLKLSNNNRIKCINIIKEWKQDDLRIIKDEEGKFLVKDGKVVVENIKKTKYKSLDTYYDVITLDLLKKLKLKNSILEYFELHFPYGLRLSDNYDISGLLYKKHGVFLTILKKELDIVIFYKYGIPFKKVYVQTKEYLPREYLL